MKPLPAYSSLYAHTMGASPNNSLNGTINGGTPSSNGRINLNIINNNGNNNGSNSTSSSNSNNSGNDTNSNGTNGSQRKSSPLRIKNSTMAAALSSSPGAAQHHHLALMPIESLTPSNRQIQAASASSVLMTSSSTLNRASGLVSESERSGSLISDAVSRLPVAQTEATHPAISQAYSLSSVMVKQEHDVMYSPSPPKAVPVIATLPQCESSQSSLTRADGVVKFESSGGCDPGTTIHSMNSSNILHLKSATAASAAQ